MLKHELRKVFRKKRDLLNSDSLFDYSIKISNNVIGLPIWEFSFFHIFLSIKEKREVDTEPLLSVLQGKDKNIIVPKVNGTNGLSHFLLTDNTTLHSNKWNIPEPLEGIEIPEEKMDVVFVPLLAFDLMGNRVGYGKGFYDRFLEKCRPDVVKIGLSFFEPIDTIKDVNENDVPLNYGVTPENVYAF